MNNLIQQINTAFDHISNIQADSADENTVNAVNQTLALLDSGKIKIAEKAKHFVMLDEPKWFINSVETFINNGE